MQRNILLLESNDYESSRNAISSSFLPYEIYQWLRLQLRFTNDYEWSRNATSQWIQSHIKEVFGRRGMSHLFKKYSGTWKGTFLRMIKQWGKMHYSTDAAQTRISNAVVGIRLKLGKCHFPPKLSKCWDAKFANDQIFSNVLNFSHSAC